MSGFQIQCTTTTPGESVTLPFVPGYTYDCIADFDDGTPVAITAWDDANATHAYATPGTYTIEITGDCPAWSVNNTHSSKLKWTAIVYQGDPIDFGGWEYVVGMFYGSPITSLGTGQLQATASLTDLSNAFRATQLTIIPPGFLDLCGNVTNFFATFYGNSLGLIIPDHLFDLCTSATEFRYTFQSSALTGVPENLWRYNTSVTSFYAALATNVNCQVPGNLFGDDFENRFLNQSVDFRSLCSNCGTSRSDNEIPYLWRYDYGTGTPSNTNWILNHGSSTAPNWKNVPVAWGGDAVSPPTISAVSDSSVFHGQSIDLTVTDALPFQYDGSVEVCDNANYALATLKIPAIIDAWADDEVTITIDKGALPDGSAYLFLTTDRGDQTFSPAGVTLQSPSITAAGPALYNGEIGATITGEGFYNMDVTLGGVAQSVTAETPGEITFDVSADPWVATLVVQNQNGESDSIEIEVGAVPPSVFASGPHDPHTRCHPAEVGALFGEEFRTLNRVTENGGDVWGSVSFDRFLGVVSDGTGVLRYAAISVTDATAIIRFRLDGPGSLFGTRPLSEGTPLDGWEIWVDDDGIHATHSDGSTIAAECLIEGDFADGEEYTAFYTIDLTSGEHTLSIGSASVTESTSITGPLAAGAKIHVGGFGDNAAGSISGARLFGAVLTEGDRGAYDQ